MRVFIAVPILFAVATTAGAQWSDPAPFGAAAVMAGAQGFARPPLTTGMLGAYAYVPARQLLLGAQTGRSFGDGHRSRAAFLMATLAYAQARAQSWQFYPYVGAGAATLRARHGRNDTDAAVGAGFGFDGLVGPDRVGGLVGARIGYVTRSLNDDTSIAFAMVSFGIGVRAGAPPADVIARR